MFWYNHNVQRSVSSACGMLTGLGVILSGTILHLQAYGYHPTLTQTQVRKSTHHSPYLALGSRLGYPEARRSSSLPLQAIKNSNSNRSAPMSSSGGSDSPQLKLMNEWNKGFQERDINHLMNLLHEDFRNVTYPGSLNEPDATKEEWYQRTAFAIGLWTHLEV